MSTDTRTIGRYAHPSRAQAVQPVTPERFDRRDDTPLFMFFDGQSFKSISTQNHHGAQDLFTSYGVTAAMIRPGKLQQNDWDWARAAVQCEYVFRAIEMVASDISSIPHGVRSRVTRRPIPNHPLTEALSWARRELHQDVLSLWQKALFVFGETYLYPISNGWTLPSTGKPYYNGIQWLNPLAVEPYIQYNRLIGYDYTAYGMDRLPKQDVVLDKVESLFDDIRGQSRVSTALESINITIQVKRFTLDSFIKDMRAQGIITGRQGSNLQQQDINSVVKLLKEQSESRLIGIPYQVEFQQIQHKWDDTQFKAAEEALRAIAAALGIPLSVLGAWFSATYQSAPAQIEFYQNNVVFRECDRLKLFIDDVLLPYYDPTGEAEWFYDKDAALALTEDKKTKTDIINSRQAAGNLTINEARAKFGEPAIPGGDALMLNGQLVTLKQLEAMSMQLAPLPPDPLTSAAPALPAVAEEKAVEPVPQPGMKSACLMLTVPNHPDLISLQGRVQQLIGQGQCTWNTPDDFHVTLVNMPVITDEQLAALAEALAEIDVPDMNLPVGSLGVFDNVGQHAVHFKLRRNGDLLDLQSAAHDTVDALGIPMSSYSRPEQYKPHITMGYAADKIRPVTFNSKLKVKAASFCLKSGDEIIFERPLGDAPKPDDPEPEPEPPAPEVKSIHDDALDELDAWYKNFRNKGAVKAMDFHNYLIRDAVADEIRQTMKQETESLDVDPEAVAAAFRFYRKKLSTKAIQSTRIDFEDSFSDLLADAMAGKISRRQWSGRMRSLIETYGYKAYVDGLRDGGVDDDPDSEDSATITSLLSAQREYISGLADKLYKDENTISTGLADQKPAMWFNGSIQPFYSSGLLAADKNGMYTWVLGHTEEHCATCKRLDGQKKRMKTWSKNNLIAGTVGQATDCKGYKCDCKLKRVAGKSSDGDLEIEHTHEHEETPLPTIGSEEEN